MLVRPAAPQDLPAIQSIYAHHVLHGAGVLRGGGAAAGGNAPPLRGRHGRGLPYLVAEEKGEVLGYGYCTLYRTRSAYRYTLEDSIYVKQGLQRKGVGKALLAELIERCRRSTTARSSRSSATAPTRPRSALHASLGFVRAGNLRSTGFKFGRWVDSVLMQLPLGPGTAAGP